MHRTGPFTYLQDDPNSTLETIGIVENPVYDGAEFEGQETFSYKNEDTEPEVPVSHCSTGFSLMHALLSYILT